MIRKFASVCADVRGCVASLRGRVVPSARGRVVLACALVLAAVAPGTVSAAFPDKPLRVIVPFAAGGGTDLWARSFARRLSVRLGQPVVVENRPGADTTIGAGAVAKAEPDGYTLLFTSGTHVQVPALNPDLGYDVVKDFAPVGRLGTVGLMFVANPSVPAANMNEFIAAARTASNWNLGTYAAGSTGAVFGQYLAKAEGLNLPTVVYKGEAPAITDVVGGTLQAGFFSVPSVKQFVNGGRLRALGILAGGRTPSFPDVPTLVEQGLPRYQWPGIWLGAFVPAATPKDVLERLSSASRAVAEDPAFVAEWTQTEANVEFKGPDEFMADIRREVQVWRELVQSLGIRK